MSGRGVGNPHYGEAEKDAIARARHMGALRMSEVIELQLQIAIMGFDTVVDPETNASIRMMVDSATRQAARKFVADRCGLSVRLETELSSAEGIPLTVIVMGSEGDTQ